jgi:hypothetical protein
MCEVIAYTWLTIGAMAFGLFAGWLGGFVHGSYWRQK